MRLTRWRTSDRSSLRHIHTILFIFLLVTVSSKVPAQQSDVSFAPDSIYLPLIIDGVYAGDIDSVPMEETTTQVDTQELLSFLEGRVAEDDLADLRLYPGQWISIGELSSFPFSVTFSMADLVIEIYIPPENTVSQDLSLLGRGDSLTYPLVEPADLSFYVNIYSSLGVGSIDHFSDSQSESFAQLSLSLYPNITYKGWALDSQFSLSTDQSIQLNHIKIIHDWPHLPLRLILGDLTYDTADNQTAPSYFGAVVTRDLSKSFDRKTYSNYERSLLVPEDNALVSILLNARRIKVIELDAGLYTMSDFFFNTGLNELAVQIETEEQTSVEEFLFAYDSNLTPSGETEYTVGIGVNSLEDLSRPGIFGTQSFGFTDHISGEYFLQADINQQNIGISSIIATDFGNFRLSGAASRIADNTIGFYTSLYYRYAKMTSPANRSISFTGSYTGETYALFSNTDSAEENPDTVTTAWKFSSTYSQSIFSLLGFSAGGSVAISRDLSVSPSFTAALRGRLSPSVAVTAKFDGTWDDAGFSPRGYIAAIIHPGNRNLSLTMKQDVYEPGNAFSAAYTPKILNGNVSLNLKMEDMTATDPFPADFSLKADYKNADYTFDIEQNINRLDFEVLYATTMHFSTAVSYADGLFGYSRPIADSFLLIAPKQRIDGYILGINPSGDSYTARTDRPGAAVLSNLSSFTQHNITIEAIELPDGFEMGADKYTFRPTYHQGGVIRLGVDSNVTVIGHMIFSDGSPVALYSGEITKKGAHTEEPEFFFTDTDGMYELYGLNSGEYVVTLYMGDGISFNLTIPEGLTGELKTKDVIIPVKYRDF